MPFWVLCEINMIVSKHRHLLIEEPKVSGIPPLFSDVWKITARIVISGADKYLRFGGCLKIYSFQ